MLRCTAGGPRVRTGGEREGPRRELGEMFNASHTSAIQYPNVSSGCVTCIFLFFVFFKPVAKQA